jgi:mannan endo-1,4-beta-mannosidase
MCHYFQLSMKKHLHVYLFICIIGVKICVGQIQPNGALIKSIRTADPKATPATKKLLNNLFLLKERHTIFGHQDCLAYGNGWRYNVSNPNGYKADVYNTCNDMPGVFGWDLGQIERQATDGTSGYLINGIKINDLRHWTKWVYENNGINTFSWHADNPVFGGSAWEAGDRTAVCKILQRGSTWNKKFNSWLNLLANFFLSLKAGDGSLIPVIFRPFHESTLVNCFWWNEYANGCKHASYLALWQYTIDYLRVTKGVHNLLYAQSLNHAFYKNICTGSYDIEEDYPGNDYVDIIGLDAYQSSAAGNLYNYKVFMQDVSEEVDYITEFAMLNNKVAAITETGAENVPNERWWTQVFAPLYANKKLAYVMLWRNPDKLNDFTSYYCVYPQHPSKPDFLSFYNGTNSFVFLRKLQLMNLYR